MVRRVSACAFLLVLAASAVFAYTPPTTDLVLELKTSTLAGASGSDITSLTPAGGTLTATFTKVTSLTGSSTPTSAANPKIEEATVVDPAKWIRNATTTTPATPLGTGFKAEGPGSFSVANGFTIVAAVRPEDFTTGTNLRSILNIYNSQLMLGIMDTGALKVRRVTAQTLTSGVITAATTEILSGPLLTSGTPTVLSMVVNANGSFKVWSSASAGTDPLMNVTSQTSWANGTITSLLKGSPTVHLGNFAYGSYYSPGASSWRGLVGNTYFYTTAFDDTARLALVDYVKQDMGMVAIPEPGSILALLVGLGSLAGFIRRKQ